MMIRDNKVTLVRQTYMPGWFMPGGGLKRGETLEQAARREAFEETGAELGEMTLMGAYTNFKDWKTDHNLVFACHDFKITGKPDKRSPKWECSCWTTCRKGHGPGTYED